MSWRLLRPRSEDCEPFLPYLNLFSTWWSWTIGPPDCGESGLEGCAPHDCVRPINGAAARVIPCDWKIDSLSRGNRGDVSTAIWQADFVRSVDDERQVHGRSAGPEEKYDNRKKGSSNNTASQDANSSSPAPARPKPRPTVAHHHQSTLPLLWTPGKLCRQLMPNFCAIGPSWLPKRYAEGFPSSPTV